VALRAGCESHEAKYTAQPSRQPLGAIVTRIDRIDIVVPNANAACENTCRMFDVQRGASGRAQRHIGGADLHRQRREPGLLALGHEVTASVDQHPLTIVFYTGSRQYGLRQGLTARRLDGVAIQP
jgi:hypothetical protein